ncbi:Restriction endonuclease MspI [Pilibacter termitis]|uniref:Restriction endonuclease MspI n=1 Tax=Pilibacter termitis TaxID=263852 RepID=A0A1T4PRY9_9ENTE|nr:MspI family type II restriction endonuclease [Pilibacter termitis]SJZ94350.1 Restriction endonuclease MspI [Pilibacter termitis]
MVTISKDNQLKNESGKASNELIGSMLTDLQNQFPNDILIQEKYAIGYPGQKEQFKMDYQISFPNLSYERWLIKSTNSIRERIYGVEFFAQNIRNIDKKASNIFVVVPNSISNGEKRNVTNYDSKTKANDYTSFLDGVIFVSTLREKILAHISKNTSQGIKSNILGKDAEVEIVKLLNNVNNRKLWNDYSNYQKTIKSSTFDIYKEILSTAGLTFGKHLISNVVATDSIPKLNIDGQKKGYPKTDVSFKVTSDKGESSHTISVKNTEAKMVTVHEGRVSDLITALQIKVDSELATALRQFEIGGSKKYLEDKYPELLSVMNNQLRKYNNTLTKFFFFGDNSPLVYDPIQIADMILYTKNFSIWTKQDYVEYYNNSYSNCGQFGTPFSWTYPSKKRGKKIQVKGFTNN